VQLNQDLRTEEEMVQGVRTRLLDAIKVRLRADVKVGVALSGGIDSSVVAGMVNHLMQEGQQVGSEPITERLSCFGVAFDEDSGFDESCQYLLLANGSGLQVTSVCKPDSRVSGCQILQEAYGRTRTGR
jgi:asparagine synthetase B (glutamine-hydrolysing)